MLPMPEINFKRTPVTLIITAVVVAIELVSVVDESKREAYYLVYRLGILSPIWSGEVWRPFTTSLLHGGPLHAAFNVYWVLVFGITLENMLGSVRILSLIILISFVSMLPQFVVTNYNADVGAQIPIVGLSGIVYGLFGMIWIGRRYHSELYLACPDQTVWLLLGWLVFCIFATQLGILQVANIAHGAGLAFGALYGQAVFDKKGRKKWAAAAIAATLVVLSTLVYCPGHNGYEYVRRRAAYHSHLHPTPLHPAPPLARPLRTAPGSISPGHGSSAR